MSKNNKVSSMRNAGIIDRIFRTIFAFFLLYFGLIRLNGLNGDILGLSIALISLGPLYIAITARCFVFRWTNFHTLSDKEVKKYGDPCNCD